MSQAGPIYLRAMAFPLAVLFALLTFRWIIPALIRGRGARSGIGHLFGQGVIEPSPSTSCLERGLWDAVRGASVETRPSCKEDIGHHYRDLLSASLGQHGFRELIFYALDLDSGQEVPFILLKERWQRRMDSRGVARTEPINLAGEAGPLFFNALMASVSPPVLMSAVPLQLPLGGRHGGEVHWFSSSLLAGQSAIADAAAAGAEQIIYVIGVSGTPGGEESSLEKLSAAALRQVLENDLRWVRSDPSGPTVFIVRPEKSRLKTFEFNGRALPGGERLGLTALVAQGERDTHRMFIQPMVGEANRSDRKIDEVVAASRDGGEAWGQGPHEL